MQFRRKLPSLTALVALEAVVRHRSVTAAARELGVTQAAVSRQIALLEAEFGRPLFLRGHRTIEPTPACLALGAALADGFAGIADAVESLRANTGSVVTIGATIAFSAFWLLPKLAEVRGLHPDIQIRVVSQDQPWRPGGGDVDIVLRYGTPPFSDGMAIASCGDRVFPVCSPDYAARHDLAAFPRGAPDLIDTEVPNRGWYRWADWFSRAGVKADAAAPALRFSHYTEAIAAARAGHGVALGWETLIRAFLDDGSLVKVGGHEFEAEGRHNILLPAGARPSGPTERVAAWLTGALMRP
ncbi:LysR substrate-binding domain-containing protein [Ensifer soli]|uniref:LysR substrate-binding domain-containing protein n=1 Tax=Ciceribacter sp. sgz301302 TaxID=3342379 RepID=UPI0035B9DA03